MQQCAKELVIREGIILVKRRKFGRSYRSRFGRHGCHRSMRHCHEIVATRSFFVRKDENCRRVRIYKRAEHISMFARLSALLVTNSTLW